MLDRFVLPLQRPRCSRTRIAIMNRSFGTRHRVEGLLESSARGLVLRMDGGGIWALDTDASAEPHVRQRVTVEGVRSGFDRIAVDWIGEASRD
jgi:hypothetical protein